MKVVLITLALICLTGCGTMKGIGQDVGTIGDWTEKGSDEVRTANFPQ